MKEYKVAIVGATGLVGEKFISCLETRNFPVSELSLFASLKSEGEFVKFRGENIPVNILKEDYPFDADIALFSAGSKASKVFSPIFAEKGIWVIDNSSAYRMDPNVALVVPEVNFEAVKSYQSKIIANPNCSTIQLVMVLAALNELCPVRRVVVSTYQSVAGAGKYALLALQEQRRGGDNLGPFNLKIMDNLIPQIGDFDENGYCIEEIKLIKETQKILGIPDFKITATVVRVPVQYVHSESVNIEFDDEVGIEDIKRKLKSFPGIVLWDEDGRDYPVPLDAVNREEVFVGRIRHDFSRENAFNLWVVADNLMKGAALNAVQIAEKLVENEIV
ncbi:aspartate-semialdehyde dehydrogenase [bacterium]|nr:aspartate-semialdehyde dehydrogenase [bacterium]